MLRKMVTERASDLFIKVGGPPCLRIDGDVHFLDTDEIVPQDTQEIFEIIEDSRREPLPRGSEVDTAYELPGIGRFRVNIYRQRGNMGFVLRHIVSNIPSFKELNLPERSSCSSPRSPGVLFSSPGTRDPENRRPSRR